MAAPARRKPSPYSWSNTSRRTFAPKLEGWGVLDFCALFRSSIGLHAVFHELPPAEDFSPDFLRRYHRYLDQWYEQRLRDGHLRSPRRRTEFTFDLYASGEYTLMLEQSWSD